MLYRPVYGTDTAVPSRRDGRVKVSVPAMGVSVWKAERRADAGAGAPVLLARAPGSGADFSGRAKISGAVLDDRFAQVTAAWRLAGDTEWTKLGTDDNAPFAVYHDVCEPAEGVAGRVPAGRQGPARPLRRGDHVRHRRGPRAPTPRARGRRRSGDPARQRLDPGQPQLRDGLPGGLAARLRPGPADAGPRTTTSGRRPITVPGRRLRVQGRDQQDVGRELRRGRACRTAATSATPRPAAAVDVLLRPPHQEHPEHRPGRSGGRGRQLPVRAGLLPGGLGDRTCLRAWLGDPDGDKIFTWTGTDIPKGDYEFKIALNPGWDVSYGEGGGGANIKFSVPADGLTVQFRWDSTTTIPTVVVSEPASSTDLTKAKAYWVKPGLLAWPADAVPPADQPGDDALAAAGRRGRRHHASTASGSRPTENYDLRYDPAGLPASVVRDFPYLKGYLALRFDASDAPGEEAAAGSGRGRSVQRRLPAPGRHRGADRARARRALRQGRQEADVRDRLER